MAREDVGSYVVTNNIAPEPANAIAKERMEWRQKVLSSTYFSVRNALSGFADVTTTAQMPMPSVAVTCAQHTSSKPVDELMRVFPSPASSTSERFQGKLARFRDKQELLTPGGTGSAIGKLSAMSAVGNEMRQSSFAAAATPSSYTFMMKDLNKSAAGDVFEKLHVESSKPLFTATAMRPEMSHKQAGISAVAGVFTKAPKGDTGLAETRRYFHPIPQNSSSQTHGIFSESYGRCRGTLESAGQRLTDMSARVHKMKVCP